MKILPLYFYPILTKKHLEGYLLAYELLLLQGFEQFGIDFFSEDFEGDHLGFQVGSSEDFDFAHELLIYFSGLLNAGNIHDRRNNIYQFNENLTTGVMNFPKIEIFEPKPNADLRKLRLGIEHAAFIVNDFDRFYDKAIANNCPIDKFSEYPDGSKFFKTVFANGVELELRNTPL